jgi:hypothetical protein
MEKKELSQKQKEQLGRPVVVQPKTWAELLKG